MLDLTPFWEMIQERKLQMKQRYSATHTGNQVWEKNTNEGRWLNSAWAQMAPKEGQKARGINETINWGWWPSVHCSNIAPIPPFLCLHFCLFPTLAFHSGCSSTAPLLEMNSAAWCVTPCISSAQFCHDHVSQRIPISSLSPGRIKKKRLEIQCKLNKMHINLITPSLGCLGSMLI